jgi:2-keto-4-pentenoate hydratase/2-oxohepta-3-ene-1,7-dioic acid hydratase in catechol pathway
VRYVRFTVDGGPPTDGVIDGDVVVAGAMRRALSSVRLLAPCVPTKIVCVGRNYLDHAREMGNDLPDKPLLFFKPPSAVIGPEDEIVYPQQSSRVDYEGELAVVIARRCHHVSRGDALGVVRGYTIVNDVTARDLQESDGQWARAKGFDTFAPIGPCIADGLDPSRLRIRTTLNGEVRQDSSTGLLIFDIPTLIEYISAAFTLEAGDVIATGTPSGIGPMRPGDEVRVEIEGVGALVNRVAAPASRSS